jgi:hypothetical protein
LKRGRKTIKTKTLSAVDKRLKKNKLSIQIKTPKKQRITLKNLMEMSKGSKTK